MPEQTTPPSPLEQTTAALDAAYPGLRRSEPQSLGEPLSDVQLTLKRTARYTWAGYEVRVSVGEEDHLDRDNPENDALYREVRAYAVLLVTDTVGVDGIGHVEWEMTNHRSEMLFPTAYAVAVADPRDPRFAAAVLSTVAKALNYARLATKRAVAEAEKAAEEARWESERPADVSPLKWRRMKRAERDAAIVGPGRR
ncbi:hypothetical protein AB0C52_24095 [Streptomyces sp. NPDC048717]|uniref:hypothetical protein n=1 Tax=Streptomyces sp. NPDC048717 TaxID=3154928 RepID=UPI0034243D56